MNIHDFLHETNKTGDFRSLLKSIQKGVFMNNEVLELSSEYGYLEIIKYILLHLAIIPSKLRDYLHLFVKHGHLEMVQYYIERKIYFIYLANDVADEVLAKASEYGQLHIVQYMLETRTRFSKVDIKHCINYALLYASTNGHLDVVVYLMKNGGDPTEFYGDGIYNSALKGHFEIIKHFVESGIDVNVFNYSALRGAFKSDNLIMVEYLLKNIKLDEYQSEQVLLLGEELGYANIVKSILSVYERQIKKLTNIL